jgi:hypothetical protein
MWDTGGRSGELFGEERLEVVGERRKNEARE